MRRPVSVVALTAITASSAAREAGVEARPDLGVRPNVIFIMADDMGWGDLGCYGNDEILTPRLDELASGGVIATDYNSCGPVCSPGRAAIVFGRYPAEIGVLKALKGNPASNVAVNQVTFVDPDLPTIADTMHAAGYVTGHYGKWHLGSKAPGLPGSTINLANYGYDVSRCTGCGPNNDLYSDQEDYQSWNSSERIIDDSIAFVQAHAHAPFYLQVWLSTPHAVLDPTPEQAAAYHGKVTGETVHGWTAPRHAYYAAVTDMDAHIGRLLDELEALGLSDNTIVIFTSDNGPASPWENSADHAGAGHTGPFRGRKHSIYEGGVRVPLIVRWPLLIPPGTVTSHPLSAVDWLQTMAAVARITVEPIFDGESILYPLAFPTQLWDRQTARFAEWRFGPGVAQEPASTTSPGGAIWSPCGTWKLLRNRDGTRVELYNLVDDPMELDNVANENPTIVADLTQQLVEWQAGLPACVGCEAEGDNAYPWP